jgi:hypothetical protein
MSDELTELIRRRDLYRLAEEKILVHGQARGSDGMQLTRGDLGKIQSELKNIESQIASYTYCGSSNRAGFGNPT